jgi:hypothetical protein
MVDRVRVNLFLGLVGSVGGGDEIFWGDYCWLKGVRVVERSWEVDFGIYVVFY